MKHETKILFVRLFGKAQDSLGFRSLHHTMTPSKVLTLDNKNKTIYFVLCSLNRTFAVAKDF